MTTLNSHPGHWDRPSLEMHTGGAPEDLGLSLSAPHNQYLFVTDIGQPYIDEKPTLDSEDTSPPESFQHRRFYADPSSIMPSSSSSSCAPQASFTATNAEVMKMQLLDHTPTTPRKTRSDGDPIAYGSCDSKSSLSLNGSADWATFTTPPQWPYNIDHQRSINQWQQESARSQFDSAPCATGRRRTSEGAEPGSARAVYLEKNRQAASKCRLKQKRQQEDLVEVARDVERKNKVLKLEVELLKSDLRDLMESVGKHNECPDGRLRKYVQQEADRLSASDDRSPIAALLSPKGSSNGDNSSPESL